jgi:rod shape-determining protein MreD
MKPLAIIAVIIAALFLQTRVSVFGIHPDLTAAAAYWIGFQSSPIKGSIFGSLIGVIEDSIGGGILGPNLLGKGLVGFLASGLSKRIFHWTPLVGMVSIFLLTAMDGLVIIATKVLYSTIPLPFSLVITGLFTQGLLNSIAGAFIGPKDAV